MFSANNIDGVLLTKLKIIDTSGGDVLHGIRSDSPGFFGFGEAYFSNVELGIIKGWKRHREMTLNLMVPIGSVRFVIYDDRRKSPTNLMFQEVILSQKNYKRLTLPPMVWFAFQGKDERKNMLLNVASIPHEPQEVDQKSLDEIGFVW